MQLLSSSNILNNPPAISNNPAGERIADATNLYWENERAFVRSELRKEKAMDFAMTSLLCASLGLVAFGFGYCIKTTKNTILSAQKFAVDNVLKFKTALLKKCSKIFK